MLWVRRTAVSRRAQSQPARLPEVRPSLEDRCTRTPRDVPRSRVRLRAGRQPRAAGSVALQRQQALRDWSDLARRIQELGQSIKELEQSFKELDKKRTEEIQRFREKLYDQWEKDKAEIRADLEQDKVETNAKLEEIETKVRNHLKAKLEQGIEIDGLEDGLLEDLLRQQNITTDLPSLRSYSTTYRQRALAQSRAHVLEEEIKMCFSLIHSTLYSFI